MDWLEYQEQKYIKLKLTFKVGDRVRIQIKKKIFDNGEDAIKYSELHRVKEVKGHKYLLDNG